MTNKRIVLSTAGSEDEAREIAHHLVEQCLQRSAGQQDPAIQLENAERDVVDIDLRKSSS